MVSGMIAIAKRLAPKRPAPKRIFENSPASGSSATAASAAEPIGFPSDPSATAVAITTQAAMKFVQMEPRMASARAAPSSSTPIPFSATADCR